MRNSLPAIFLFGALSGVLVGTMAACGADPVSPTELPPAGNAADEALAVDLAIGLAKACPLAAPGDEGARQACGEGLAKFALLRDRMEEPFLWGGQGADKPLDLYENHLTRFNPLVWRKMYASLFMFGSDFRIEQVGTQTLLSVPFAFRGALDTGSYPYPFWHSKGKWDSYQLATELVFFIEDGKLLGAMRSAKQDPSRPFVPQTFDGKWEWATPEGLPAPASAMLYSKLFSPQNAMVPELNRAFRALEEKARSQNCNSCHSPDNAAKASQLVLLNYPNQAIFARNSIVAELETNTMPLVTGVTNEAERQELLHLAREFQAIANQALRLEGERVR